MRKKVLSLLVLVFALTNVVAQEKSPQVSFGIAGGGHFGNMNFSKLNSDQFYNGSWDNSGLFSAFVEIDFLKNGLLGIRPQASVLNRNGSIHADLDKNSKYKDVAYKLHAHYVDFRMPIMLQFGNYSSAVRPYLFVSPVLGFCTGGNISYEYTYPKSASYNGYRVGVSDANMASIDIAAQAGVGVKFAVPVANDRCYVGLEVAYEKGIGDTYGSKEIDHDATNVLNTPYRIKGTRKLDGIEAQAVLTIPFSVFKKKTITVTPEPVAVKIEPKPEPKRKPCYTLSEISDMIQAGESVRGKKICAISDINFDHGKHVIKPESYGYLNELARVLIALNRKVFISGHTDNSGTDKINEKLSKDRADAVAKYLTQKGLKASLITTAGYGDSQPIGDNATNDGRAQNRRVEFDLE